MASVEKFSGASVRNILAHSDRKITEPSNKDIDPSRSHLNYSVLVREQPPYDYYRARKQELHCLHRDDVKLLCGWVLTAPRGLPEAQQEIFFKESYNFVSARYGEINMVQAVVHKDESGQPHIHICFIPAVPDLKHGGEKICANDVITRKDLITFHSDWQHYLDDLGIDAVVQSGITKTQGGNITVAEMKRQRNVEISQCREIEQSVEHDRWDEPTVEACRNIDDWRRW